MLAERLASSRLRWCRKLGGVPRRMAKTVQSVDIVEISFVDVSLGCLMCSDENLLSQGIMILLNNRLYYLFIVASFYPASFMLLLRVCYARKTGTTENVYCAQPCCLRSSRSGIRREVVSEARFPYLNRRRLAEMFANGIHSQLAICEWCTTAFLHYLL